MKKDYEAPILEVTNFQEEIEAGETVSTLDFSVGDWFSGDGE